MSFADPDRYRERLLAGLSDDGLEDLTLRLIKPEYPDAHRTRRGRDGGIDVLSDLEVPAQRAWQAKNCRASDVPWSQCAKSLKTAMAGSARPRSYTFVFPRRLKARERDHWRDSFLPEQRALYPDLERLDYWDDLQDRLADRQELVDLLSDGALGVYLRPTLETMASTGVNPVASAEELARDAWAPAVHAQKIGASDPYFAYRESGGEVDAFDEPLGDRWMAFTLSRTQRDGLPQYKVALRDGALIKEISAKPRADVEIVGPEAWFAPDNEGARLRNQARLTLAGGQALTLEGDHVGLVAGSVPDWFRGWVRPDGILRNGRLDIGLSDPLPMTVTFYPRQADGAGIMRSLPMYAVPPLPGDTRSFAGVVHGTMLSADLKDDLSDIAIAENEVRVVVNLGVTFFVSGLPPDEALRGLAFAGAFGQATRVRFDCPGLLPDGGIFTEGQAPPEAESHEIWEATVRLGVALAGLNRRDGKARTMPTMVTPREQALADLVLHLLKNGESRVTATGTFEVAVPATATMDGDLRQCLRLEWLLPPLCDEETGLRVEQSVLDATPLRVARTEQGAMRVVCQADGEAATILIRLLAD